MLSDFSHSPRWYVELLVTVVYVSHIVGRFTVVRHAYHLHVSSNPIAGFQLFHDTHVICETWQTRGKNAFANDVIASVILPCLTLIDVSRVCSFPYACMSFSNCRNSDFMAIFRTKNIDGLTMYVTSTLYSETPWKRKKTGLNKPKKN